MDSHHVLPIEVLLVEEFEHLDLPSGAHSVPSSNRFSGERIMEQSKQHEKQIRNVAVCVDTGSANRFHPKRSIS